MSVAADAPETSISSSLRSQGVMRLATVGGFIAAGCLDYVTGVEIASALFYIPVLLALAFVEPWLVCLGFSLLATAISLGADLLWDPARLILAHLYWSAFTRLLVFALLTSAVSMLVQERKRLRESERVLENRAVEVQDKNRRIEATFREATRLREDLTRREGQAAIGDAMFATAYEMERPLASPSVYVEELSRLVERASSVGHPRLVLDEIQPLLEKLRDRIHSMERILEEVRDLHKSGPQA